MESLGVKINLPITVRVDNTGAIFVQKYQYDKWYKTRGVHTKYVNEYCEDGVVDIIFVESASNKADIFTKILGQDLHSKHSNKLFPTKRQAVRRTNSILDAFW